MSAPPPVIPNAKKNRRVALIAGAVFCSMLGLAYASVPLYRIFCQTTGFGGTTMRAEAAPAATVEKYINVRFDANIAQSLGWSFQPEQKIMRVKLGEANLVNYKAVNHQSIATVGTATYNVSPAEAGVFFNKLECFCFTRQELQPQQAADLGVQFFIDPEIANDPDSKSISEITLSYTFYPADKTADTTSQPQKTVTN